MYSPARKAVFAPDYSSSYWKNYDIKAGYIIAFTNFVLTGYRGQLRIDVRLTDGEGSLFSDKLRLIYLQMPCFAKDADECENQFERWIYILKNMEILDTYNAMTGAEMKGRAEDCVQQSTIPRSAAHIVLCSAVSRAGAVRQSLP